MSAKERLRMKVLAGVANGSTTLSAAAATLGLSYRQMRRVRRRHVDDGDGGLVHKLRGQASNRRTPEAVRTRVLALCRGGTRASGRRCWASPC